MTGSIADHDALSFAWARHMLAECAFDAFPTPEGAAFADQTYVEAVQAAARVDPHSLRSASMREWIEKRLELYRAQCRQGWA